MQQVLPGFLSSTLLGTLGQLARDPAAFGVQSGWAQGRQQSGYENLALGQGPLGRRLDDLTWRSLELVGAPGVVGWDRFLIRYLPGSSIPAHVDPPLAQGLAHWRLNAVIEAPTGGGVLYLDGEATELEAGDAVIFRPDLIHHEVSEITAGTRLLWSIGSNVSET